MTTDQNVEVPAMPEDFDTKLLDPSTWEEPKDLIPVIVERSRFRWSSPDYNAATEFRPAFPRSIQQWDFVLRRLDAVIVHKDGSDFIAQDGTNIGPEASAYLYAGVDLEKLVVKPGQPPILRGIMKTRGKGQRVISEWVKHVGSLVPDPSRIEGMMFEVAHYRELEIASGFFAKNVSLPVTTLPPTYTFQGTVQRFLARDDDTAVTAADVQAAQVAAVGGSDEKEAAAAKIVAFLTAQGIDAADADVSLLGHADFPASARIEPFTSAFAAGTVAEVLAGFDTEA